MTRTSQDLPETTDQNPQTAEDYFNRARVHHNQGRLDLALQDYNQAIRLDPEDAASYNNRALVHHNQGRLDLALQDFNQAIRLDPNHANAFHNRANLHKDEDRVVLALQDCEEAIRLDPTHVNARHNHALLQEGQDRLKKKLQDYNDTIQQNPQDAATYQKRAYLHKAQGRLKEALQDYNDVIRLKPNANAYHSRALLHIALGYPDTAFQDFNEAIRLNPKDASAYFNRAFLHRSKGRQVAALIDLYQSFELNPLLENGHYKRQFIYKSSSNAIQKLAALLNPADSLSVRQPLQQIINAAEQALKINFQNNLPVLDFAELQEQLMRILDQYILQRKSFKYKAISAANKFVALFTAAEEKREEKQGPIQTQPVATIDQVLSAEEEAVFGDSKSDRNSREYYLKIKQAITQIKDLNSAAQTNILLTQLLGDYNFVTRSPTLFPICKAVNNHLNDTLKKYDIERYDPARQRYHKQLNALLTKIEDRIQQHCVPVEEFSQTNTAVEEKQQLIPADQIPQLLRDVKNIAEEFLKPIEGVAPELQIEGIVFAPAQPDAPPAETAAAPITPEAQEFFNEIEGAISPAQPDAPLVKAAVPIRREGERAQFSLQEVKQEAPVEPGADEAFLRRMQARLDKLSRPAEFDLYLVTNSAPAADIEPGAAPEEAVQPKVILQST